MTLEEEIKNDWDRFLERTRDLPSSERITRLADYTRAVTALLAGEIDKLRG